MDEALTMNKLLILPLILLAFSALMTQLINSEQTIYSYDDDGNTYTWDPYNQTVNGTEIQYETEGWTVNAGFDLQTGVIAVIIVMLAVGIVAGIQVFGSGLSEISVKVIYTSIFFYTLWLLLSVFGLPSITAVPVFGWVFYFFLTLLYSVGIVGQINGTE